MRTYTIIATPGLYCFAFVLISKQASKQTNKLVASSNKQTAQSCARHLHLHTSTLFFLAHSSYPSSSLQLPFPPPSPNLKYDTPIFLPPDTINTIPSLHTNDLSLRAPSLFCFASPSLSAPPHPTHALLLSFIAPSSAFRTRVAVQSHHTPHTRPHTVARPQALCVLCSQKRAWRHNIIRLLLTALPSIILHDTPTLPTSTCTQQATPKHAILFFLPETNLFHQLSTKKKRQTRAHHTTPHHHYQHQAIRQSTTP